MRPQFQGYVLFLDRDTIISICKFEYSPETESENATWAFKSDFFL